MAAYFWQRYDRTWGTHVELQAAASLLKLPIYVFTQEGGSGDYYWEIFKPMKDPQASRLYHYEICHTLGCHYDLITLTDGLRPIEPPFIETQHSYLEIWVLLLQILTNNIELYAPYLKVFQSWHISSLLAFRICNSLACVNCLLDFGKGGGTWWAEAVVTWLLQVNPCEYSEPHSSNGARVTPLKVKHVKSKTPETGKKNNIAHKLICAPALKITIAVCSHSDGYCWINAACDGLNFSWSCSITKNIRLSALGVSRWCVDRIILLVVVLLCSGKFHWKM